MRAIFIKAIFILFLLQPALFTLASGIKHIGTPLITQYKRADFNAGRQTWMIEQGADGMMYFANNDGLLEFDGNEWRIYQLPNRTIVRCIRSDGKGRIYAGGFNEFGFFEADSAGHLQYQSMTGLLPADKKEFGEVWKIHLTPTGVIFQAFPRIMIVTENGVECIEAPGEFHFSYYIKGELYLVDRVEGLLRMAFGKLFPVVGADRLKGQEIWGMIPLEDKILLATSGRGIYLYDGSGLEIWNKDASLFLDEWKVFCVSLISEDVIAFGTIQNGLVITDRKGNFLQSINRDKGLQNNTVLSMNTDDYDNLWLGLDNGIDYIEVNSPLSRLSYQHGLNSGYAAVIHKGMVYLGTNQGVYATDWEQYNSLTNHDITFKLVENTSGQVWTLQVIEGTLFCGHNNGTYIIEGYKANNISALTGAWTYIQLQGYPEQVVSGTYSGLYLYEKSNGNWKFKHKIKGFYESSRDIIQDADNNIWMCHGLKGVYKIRLNDRHDTVSEVTFYNSANGLPSDIGTTAFRYRDSVYFATEKGIFRYRGPETGFQRSAAMAQLLGDHFYRRIILDAEGNIWYFKENTSGVYRIQEDGSYIDISLPFKQVEGGFIGGFQFVYPFDKQNVFFGSENGFIHYDPSFSKDYSRVPNSFIREVLASNSDTILFSGTIREHFRLDRKVGFTDNSLQFFFSSNEFENPERIEYATLLEGLETSWSGWGFQSNREFTNLREGDYTFYVKSRNIYGVESGPVSVSFSISPPWRRSFGAYVFYTALVLAGSFVALLLIRRKILKSKLQAEQAKESQFRKREEELQRVSLESEKEVIRLRNEKLREEMLLKDKELANSTLQMIQKNKLLVKLIDDLKQIQAVTKDTEQKSHLRSLIKKINKDIDTESQWKIFEIQFEKVHEEFLKRIKAEYPSLTPGELRLCAYLRLNISSKEIALLMNISTRGVEISRYRLRKKLNLDRETNLIDFIMAF